MKELISLKDKLTEEQLSEYYYEKNDIGPEKISYGSAKKAFWKCKLGHSYFMAPNKKTNQNSGCPYCSNNKVLVGFNDLKSCCPNLVKEWDYELNDKKPEELTYGTNYKANWICNKGHKYKAIVTDRRYG